ncbi:MAG: hypothetical protein WC417_07480, partial [Candidatus Omnitrophota bacterium]
YNIAKVHKIFGNHRGVIAFCKKAIAINPNYAPVYFDLCTAYGITNNFKEAIKACSEAVRLNSRLASAYYNLSVACYFDKQYGLAAAHLQTALKLGYKPDPGFMKQIEQHKEER